MGWSPGPAVEAVFRMKSFPNLDLGNIEPVSRDIEPSLCRQKTDIEKWGPETGA